MQKISGRLNKFKPKISSNIRFRFLKENERGCFYIIEKTGKGTKPVYLRIHEAGKETIGLMNGKLTLSQINEILKERNIEIDLIRFVELLGRKGFIQNYPLVGETKTEEKKKSRVRHFPILRKPEKFIVKIYSPLRFFFTRRMLIPFLIFNVAISLFFALFFSSNMVNLGNMLTIRNSSFIAFFLYMIVLFPPVVFLHELAHAITCFHYGGKIGEIGLSIYLFAPFFYVDTSGTWMLPKRQSVMVFLAGPLCTLFIGNLSFLSQFFVPLPYNKILLMITFASYFSTLFGFNPLMETDGYYVLQTLVDFPNLHSNAWDFMGMWLKRKTRRIPEKEYQEYLSCYSRDERRILSLYTPLVVTVNLMFLLVTIFWILLLFNEYIVLTLQIVVEKLANVDASRITLWVFESFYFSIIIFVFLREAIRVVTGKIKVRKSRNLSKEERKFYKENT
jgi:hypothetical protein